MRCEAVRELAAAYALDTLEPDERAAVETHLAECPEPHGEFADARATALALASAAPERDPSTDLRARILRDVRAGGAARSVARWRMLASAAAVVAALAVGIAGWALMTSPGASMVHLYSTETGGWLRVEASDGRAAVELGGLPPTIDESYQVWIVRDGTPISLEVFEADAPGPWSGTATIAVHEGDILAVTREPRGGSPAPTTAPLMQTDF